MAEAFDMRPLKTAATRLLPPGSPLLQAVLSDPDSISRELAVAKLATYYAVAQAMHRSQS